MEHSVAHPAPPPLTTRTRNLLLSLIIFIVLVLLALVVLPPLIDWRETALDAALERAQTLSVRLTDTENSLQQMQAAARGYIITHSPAFRAQYQAAATALPAQLQQLGERDALADPALAPQLAELAAAISYWQHERLSRQVALVDQGELPAVVAELAGGASQDHFDAIRDQLQDLQAQIHATTARLSAQVSQARAIHMVASRALGILGLIALAIVFAAFWRIVGLLRDNARLYAEATAERRRLQAIFEHSPAGLVVAAAPEGHIALVNQRASALLGDLAPDVTLCDHPLAGRAFSPAGEPVAPERLPLAATLADGQERQNIELLIVAPDGARMPVLTTSVPLRDDQGVVTGAIAVFQDLRPLREVERLKADFVALVSHELRTPLTAIKGCTATLLRSQTADPGRVREFLQIIDEQGDRLQELIDNLLSLAQVGAGTLRLRRTTMALKPIIYEVLQQQRAQAEGLRIQADLPAELPPVSADPRRVAQVLHNLLDNARRFSPAGGVITLRAHAAEDAVCLCVRDQGPGIPPDERERVFERFYQGARPAGASGGSGLGLAICKALVEAHGGQIGAADAPGGGAELWLTLPALPVATAALELPRAIRQASATRVLVVDDDQAVRWMLDRGLADAGYAVQTVVEGQAALTVMTQQPSDLVLLDLMLPGVDGLELCRQLRQWTNVPIIMLTARAAEQDIVRGLQLGADDYVTKPFRLGELLARMQAVLRRARPCVEPGGISVVQINQLTVDLALRRVSVDGQEIVLTPTEYGILAYLAQHAGQVLTHAQILKAVWGETYGAENNYLWVHIAHVRQKIEADPKQPRYILTERGVGYRLIKPYAS